MNNLSGFSTCLGSSRSETESLNNRLVALLDFVESLSDLSIVSC